MMNKPLLSIQNLSIYFDQTLCVNSLNFEVYSGERLAIVGESGSGKTQTAYALMRLNTQANYSGIIQFNPSNSASISNLLTLPEHELNAIRGRRIAMIFQEPMTALNPLHTIGQQISENLFLHQSLTRAAAKKRVAELLTRVALSESLAHRFPHQLSGGQRQRAMIAMALAGEPELLIADEPTTALDMQIREKILALLDEIQRERNMALVLITHDLTMVKHHSDRVLVMRSGQCVECETSEQLFSTPKHDYTKMLLASMPNATPPKALSTSPILRVQTVSVQVAGEKINWFQRATLNLLSSISFEVLRGETLGILGESGSGKSTLALAILRLLSANGSVFMEERDIFSLNAKQLRAWRKTAQIIFQDPFSSLSPRRSIFQILEEALAQTGQTLTAQHTMQLITQQLAEVGLPEDAATRYPHEFSGGQRQRIAIARALMLRPKILILDEPTSALDVSVQSQVLDLLKYLQEKHGLTYLLISHDLAVIRAMSHRVLLLKSGNIEELCDAREFFAAPQSTYGQALLRSAYLI